MARKSNSLNPVMYGLTQQDVERVIRIHTMCKDMDEDAFEQMETAAASINLVASLKKLDNRPWHERRNHMTDITIINKEVKKMKDNKKPGEPVASSRDVAKRFGKRHDHVIRDIAEIVKSFPKNGDTPLFFKTEYVHPQNHQKYPMYLMNRDGFSLLAMGFTGKEAAQ